MLACHSRGCSYEKIMQALGFGEPLNIRQIMEAINERNLAKLPGKTPGATVSVDIQREISKKGETSRFFKAGKGLFAAK